jgi:hypothetical protein
MGEREMKRRTDPNLVSPTLPLSQSPSLRNVKNGFSYT